MIAAETVVANKKLKIKFSSHRIEVVPGSRSREFGKQSSLSNEWGYNASLAKNAQSHLSKSQNLEPFSGAKKRGRMAAMDVQREKRQKMDRSVTHQCSALLKTLMNHDARRFFRHPVDPVKLKIPDYFSVISNPMDLGTVKSKLEKNLYVGTEEFVADITLTFSNAKLYNPPDDCVHKMAEELQNIFQMKWKSLNERWNCQKSKFGAGKPLHGRIKEISDMRPNRPKTPPLRSAILLKRSKLSEQKDSTALEVKLAKPTENCLCQSSEQNFQKGTDIGGRHTSGPVIAKAVLSRVACKYGTCGGSECHCSVPSSSSHASSDISSERSSGRDHHACSSDTSKLDCQAKTLPTSQRSKSDADSDGAVSALDDDNAYPRTQLITPATDATSSEEGCRPLFDAQLSPTKALRAAMLRQRFADTILKAQHKTLLDQGEKADPVKMQKEKERLERRQHEEKARIKAEIKAAETASRRKEEIESKKQREREREAARVALEQMEKTVQIEQNLEIIKELEKLSGCSLSYDFHFCSKMVEVGNGETRSYFRRPLERFGLFIKDDIEDEDEDLLNTDGEEGEILS